MSDEKIDHAAKAEELLSKNPGDPAIGPEWGAVLAQTAAAHATLALVEQQRIANLIAYGRGYSVQRLVRGSEVIHQWRPSSAEEVNGVNQEIRKGLGL